MMSVDRRRQAHYGYVDGMRAIAVLGVVAYHVMVGDALTSNRVLPPIFNIGARGVDLFFVISGFCLSLPYLRKARESGYLRIDYGTFVARRVARIAPPYYVAIALFTLLAASPFGYPTTYAPSIAALDHAGAREFLPNLAFLTTLQPVVNGSFWTLGVEMRWYLLCPLLIALFVKSRSSFAAVMIAAYAIHYVAPQRLVDAGTLPAFMLGIVAAAVSLGRRKHEALAAMIAIPLLAFAVARQSGDAAIDHGDPLWHAMFFVLVVVASARIPARVLSSRPLVLIGGASYSIYLVHQPIGVFLGTHGFFWPVAGAIGVAFGIAFWAIVERPFLRDRERIAFFLQRLSKRYARPPIVVEAKPFEA